MRVIKLLPLFWLVTACAVLPCSAQSGAEPILHNWITQDQVILWRSETDSEPITAVFDPRTGEWSVALPRDSQAWRPVIERVVQSYLPETNLKDVGEARLWSFALAKLRNEYGAVRWAQLLRPTTEIYLLPVDERSVKVAILYEVNGKPGRQVIEFAQRDGRWVKGADLPLEATLGLTTKSEGLRKVLDISEAEQLPTARQWPEIWDRWVRTSLANNRSVRPITYQDMNGRTRLLWQERLSPRAELPATFRQLPPAPQKITEPVIEENAVVPVQDSGGLFNSIPDHILVAIILASLALAVFLYFFRNTVFSALKSLREKLTARERPTDQLSNKQAESSLPHAPPIPSDTLDLLHRLALERCQKSLEGDAAARDILITALHWVHQEYLTLANSNQLLQAAKDSREGVVKDFLREDLGEEKARPEELKRWIKLGRLAEGALSQVNGLKIPDEVQKALPPEPTLRLQTGEEWVQHWPALLSAFAQCLRERKEEYEGVSRSLKEQIEKHDKAVADKERALEITWKGRVTDLEKNNKKLEGDLQKMSSELERERSQVDSLQAQIRELHRATSTADEEKKATQNDLATLRRKVVEIQEVKLLSRDLRGWLQGYYDGQIEDGSEIRPVALLASLINFSLCQMCFSIIENEPSLTKVMAHNIFRLTERFEQRYGKDSDFVNARGYLSRIVPGVENTLEVLQKGDLGGDTLDDPLFRGFLSRLNTDTGKNLSPFFIDIDKHKKTLVHVSTS